MAQISDFSITSRTSQDKLGELGGRTFHDFGFLENHLKVVASPQNGPKLALGGPHCPQHDPWLRADYEWFLDPGSIRIDPGVPRVPLPCPLGPSTGPLGSRTPFLCLMSATEYHSMT